MPSSVHPRLNIYLGDPDLRAKIKIAAARAGVTLSDYCLESIRRRLTEEGILPETTPKERKLAAAQGLDKLRRKVGPIGTRVSDLIAEGRRR